MDRRKKTTRRAPPDDVSWYREVVPVLGRLSQATENKDDLLAKGLLLADNSTAGRNRTGGDI